MKKIHKKWAFSFSIILLPVLLLSVFTLYPMINTFIMSFQKTTLEGDWYFAGVANFVEIFRDIKGQGKYSQLIIAIKNTLWFIPVNLGILIPIPLLCAYYMQKNVKGANTYRIIFFLPAIISASALTISFRFMFNPQVGLIVKLMEGVGLGNMVPAAGFFGTTKSSLMMVILYCVWAGIGYNILLIQGAIARIPQELFESASLDGAGMRHEFFNIVLPLSMPSIATLVILGFTGIFSVTLQPMLLTGTDDTAVTTIGTYILKQTVSGTNDSLISGATIGVLLTVILAPIVIILRWALEKVTPEVGF